MIALVILALTLEAGAPYVYDVPRGAPSLEKQRRPLFFAAPFSVQAGRVVRGEWRSSDQILTHRPTRVVVVASWCPACHSYLRRLLAERPQRTVILFVEDEAERRGAAGGAPLSNAASLERYPLEFHLLSTDSPIARVSQFPTFFTCSRKECRQDAKR